MLDRYRVVAAVPAGRRRYLEILFPYLLAHKGLIDECQLWCNTLDAHDRAYLEETAALHPFFRLVEPTVPVNGIWSVYHYFQHCVDPDTVYIRFDDDICWVAPGAVEKLLRFRIDNPQYALVLANTINNSLCSHIHQRMGCISLREGFCTYEVVGDVGWRSGPFARLAHESFLTRLECGGLSSYLFERWVAWQYERISINCISWMGRAFRLFGGCVGVEDEHWLTVDYPRALKRPTAVCGEALVSHFAYGPQRPWLEAETDLLERYRRMSMNAPGEALVGAVARNV